MVINMFATVFFLHVVSTITFAQDFPRLVTLVADNGKFLSRVAEGGANPIQADKSVQDIYCEFTMIKLEGEDEGLYAFQADNGMYLSRYTRSGKQRIEAAKLSIDAYCKFKVERFVADENIITILADNDRYWSRWTHEGTDYIEAAKFHPDIFCRFKMADA